MMNIFKFELKKGWFSTLFWSIGIVGAMLLYIAFFPTMAADPEMMDIIMRNFPEEFLSFFGLNGDLPFGTILGYYALTMQFISAAIAIHATYLGLSILSIEERELTADFLLTRPVTRTTIFTTKSFAALSHIIIVWAVIFINTLVSTTLFRAGQIVDYNALIIYSFGLFFFQISFFAIGLLVSLIVPKFDNVITYAIAIGFGFFVIASMGDMFSADWVQYLTPFGHFNPNSLLVSGFNGLIFINIALSVICLSASYKLYITRNIHSL
jgi:ABC-2 type transport system permease protein